MVCLVSWERQLHNRYKKLMVSLSWLGFPAELRRLRSEGENVLAQAEREKQALTQTLNAAQLEAQQSLRKAISEHQEEVERLVSEKVRRFTG